MQLPTSLLPNGPEQSVLPSWSELLALTSWPIPDWHYQIHLSFVVLQEFLQQPTWWSKVTSVPSRMSQCTSQSHGGQAEQSGDLCLQDCVPVALEWVLSPSPADSTLNSLSGWNIQEALEEWIIHSVVLLPMDLRFLVPIRCPVFVLTVIGYVCASFDGSWGQVISSIFSTHSNNTTHQSACQTQFSSELLLAISLTKWLDSFQGSLHHQQPSLLTPALS